MADEVALMEEADLEALAAMNTEQRTQIFECRRQNMSPEDEMEALLFSLDEQSSAHEESQPQPDTPYGSDEDEYDHIFMEVIQEETRTATKSANPPNEDDIMDMS